jgi:hypothetical protein
MSDEVIMGRCKRAILVENQSLAEKWGDEKSGNGVMNI